MADQAEEGEISADDAPNSGFPSLTNSLLPPNPAFFPQNWSGMTDFGFAFNLPQFPSQSFYGGVMPDNTAHSEPFDAQNGTQVALSR